MPLTTMTRDARDTQSHPRRRAATGTDASESDQQLFYFPRMDSLTPHHQQQQQQQASGGGFSTSQGLVRHRNNLSTFSLSSHVSFTNRVSTLEAYELIYGDGPPPSEAPQETAERLYERHAEFIVASLKRISEVYENPLITASSRKVIGDIHALSRQLREVGVPRPLAMFRTLFRPSESDWEGSGTWFQAVRVWSEMDEVYDSESFDGHRQSIIEHTVHVLILPGIHSDARFAEHAPADADASSSSSLALVSLPTDLGHAANPKPVLTIPGFRRLPLPSPLHMKLHVISRLSFNEQGRITRHRDFYDVRDVLALVPGVRAAQWIGARAAARGLAWTSRLAAWVFGRRRKGDDFVEDDMEGGLAPSASPMSASVVRADAQDLNALGLHESGSGSNAGKLSIISGRRAPCQVDQAPDVDRDRECE